MQQPPKEKSRTHRRYVVGIMAALVGVAVATGIAWKGLTARTLPKQNSSRPNVVLISMDTTRADHLDCYGYRKPTSPNLDRLAAGGVRYANCRSQAPWTLPSHMALFTSLLPSHNHICMLNSVLSKDIPTLAEILQGNGYHTAGLVNDGQMKTTWGFHRGFRQWLEYPAEAPAGNCVHLTDRALQWLSLTPAEPFFLFLHYYDPHDPYDPPAEFRERFGAPFSGEENSAILHRTHFPSEPIGDREKFSRVVAAYDGEIAWLDSQLARLFTQLPNNTLVVVFSDHGEGFKEHGWTLHGSAVYEEDVHVALVMSMSGMLPAGHVVSDPVMLLDVAPTILGFCGVAAPPHYEGVDLAPTWTGHQLPERLSLSETFAPYEGTGLKMVALNEWKLIRSVFDGREELYRLPDEKTDVGQKDAPMRTALSDVARRWAAEEDFWMLHAHGPEEISLVVSPRAGQFLNVIPFGEWRGDAQYEVDPNGRFFRWSCTPGNRTVSSFLQIAPNDAALHFELTIGGKKQLDKVFTGARRVHPAQLPFVLALADADASEPVIDKPFVADKPGFYAFRHRGKGTGGFAAVAGTLDEATIRQLRSLGYLR